MDVKQAESFLVMSEELHFGRAARRLHIAQPPLSRQIQALERDLGCLLFDRTTRTVRLTKSGEALVAPARALVAAARAADDAVRGAEAGEAGRVKIAFAGASSHQLVAHLARLVRHDLPSVVLDLDSHNFAQPLMRRLVAGEIDLALGRWDVVHPSVSTDVALRDELVLAVPDTHALAGADGVDPGAMTDLSFVSLVDHEGAVMPDRLRRLGRDAGFAPEVIQVAPDTQTALALVAAEVGCHLTLRSVADAVADPHLRFVPVTADVPDVHLRVAWRTSEPAAVVRAVLERVRQPRT